MNICVLVSLLFFLAPGGCPIYSIDVSTLEVPTVFQNDLTLQSMLDSELHKYLNKFYKAEKIDDDEDSILNDEEKIDDWLPHEGENSPNEIPKNEDEIKNAETPSHIQTKSVTKEAEKHEISKMENTPHIIKPSFIVSRKADGSTEFLGTNLFGSYPKKCFSAEDIAVMAARKDFEALVPKSYPQSLVNDKIVYMLMRYFNTINQMIKRLSNNETQRLLQRAFYDTMGGYLRFYLVPIAQVSYYAGRLKLCTVERLIALYRQCKIVLNTNGNGWKEPLPDVLSALPRVLIDPLKVEEEKDNNENDAASCALLDQTCTSKDAQNNQIMVPLPRLEAEDRNGYLSNIFLPFRQRRIYNLQSSNSAFILTKFFKAVTNCYHFQGMSQKNYNLKLRAWIREHVQIHYKDEMFYPGLGGILQIYESIKPNSPKCKNKTDDANDLEFKEEKSEDYEVRFDDLETEGQKCAKINNQENSKNYTKPESSKKKAKSIQRKSKISKKDSNKLVRSPEVYPNLRALHDQQTDDDTVTVSSKVKSFLKDEDCVDCNDSNYVGYIAAFLSLLLLLLLIIIFFVMRRGRPHAVEEPAPRNKSVIEKPIYDEPAAKPPKPEESSPPQPSSDAGCCGALFRSRKHKKRTPKPGTIEDKSPGQSDPATLSFQDDDGFMRRRMGVREQERVQVGTRTITIKDSDKPSSAKNQPQPEVSLEFLYHGYTSTSSLNCQFPKKCLPFPHSSKKQESYYKEPKRAHRKTRTRESVWDSNRRSSVEAGQLESVKAKPQGISEEHTSYKQTQRWATSSTQKPVNPTARTGKVRSVDEDDDSKKLQRCEEIKRLRKEEERLEKCVQMRRLEDEKLRQAQISRAKRLSSCESRGNQKKESDRERHTERSIRGVSESNSPQRRSPARQTNTTRSTGENDYYGLKERDAGGGNDQQPPSGATTKSWETTYSDLD